MTIIAAKPSVHSPVSNACTTTSMSTQRREKKRKHDREAQRASRERSRQQVAHLEELVRNLQAASQNPGQLDELLTQVEKARAESRRLRDILSRVHTLTSSDRVGLEDGRMSGDDDRRNEKGATPSELNAPGTPIFGLDIDQSHEPRIEPLGINETPDNSSLHNTMLFGSLMDFPGFDIPDQSLDTADHQIEDSMFLPTTTIATTAPSCLQSPNASNEIDVVAVLASKALSTPKLEGRYWVVGATILNHILNDSEDIITPRVLDDDIAIRASVHGWHSVTRLYGLDAGWRWVRVLDETMYGHLGIPQRMAILRIQRMQYLAQRQPSREDLDLPEFMAARPAQQRLDHEKLMEHFVWPGLRERILFTTKYKTNKFGDCFAANLQFFWPRDPWDTYERDPTSELFRFTPLFLLHVSRLGCWQLAPQFFNTFPELAADMPCSQPSLLGPRLRFRHIEYGSIVDEEDEDMSHI